MIPDGMPQELRAGSCNRDHGTGDRLAGLRDAPGVHGERIVAREIEDWLTARQGNPREPG